MASVCEICRKKPWFGKKLSHSPRRPTTKRGNVCTGCLKAGKIQKAAH